MHLHFKCFYEVHMISIPTLLFYKKLFILKEIYKDFGRTFQMPLFTWLCVFNQSSLQKWIKTLTFDEEHTQPHGESSCHGSAETTPRRLFSCLTVTAMHNQDRVCIKTNRCRSPRGFLSVKKGETCNNSKLWKRSHEECYLCCLRKSGNTSSFPAVLTHFSSVVYLP